MSLAPITLDRFILEAQQVSPGATGELSLILMRFGVAGKRIASALARAGLTG
jgi:fructose-1,6-bisphosphatase